MGLRICGERRDFLVGGCREWVQRSILASGVAAGRDSVQTSHTSFFLSGASNGVFSLIAYGEKPVRKIVNFIAKTLMCYRSRMYTGRRRTDRAGLGVYDCVVCGGEVFTIPQDQYFNVIEPSWICTDCGVLYVDPDGQTSMRKQNASSFAPQAWVQDTAIHVRRA